MLKKKGGRCVVSDSGFEVKIKSRGALLYTEGNKSININSEYLAENGGIAVYANSIEYWNDQHKEEKISSQKKQQILDNVNEALLFLKINAEIC